MAHDAPMLETAFADCVADRVAALARMSGRPSLVDDRVAVTAMSTETIWGNFGILRRPDADLPELAADLADAIGVGTPFILYAPWPDLDPSPLGLADEGRPPLMLRPVGAGAGAGQVPEELTLERVEGPEALAEWEQCLITGYPAPGADVVPPLTLFPEPALGGDTAFWMLRDGGGEVVAVAAGHVAHGIVDVEFVAAQPAVRGRGAGAAVTRAAADTDPGLPSMLVSSDLGRGVYEGLGYLPLRRWGFWIGTVPEV